jgi:hypothetical protein
MSLRDEAKHLEDSFFLQKDRKMIEHLQQMQKMQQNKESLRAVSGIQSEPVLEKLAQLDIQPQTLAALVVVPLVLVAWADGEVDDQERAAVLSMMEKHGIQAGSVEHQLLESWLSHRPEPHLFQAWNLYITGLCKEMRPEEVAGLRDTLLRDVLVVAEASGGFLGIGKVSREEKDVIGKLQAAFA